MPRFRLSIAAVMAAVLLPACREDDDPVEPAVTASPRTTLLWKRDHAIEQDLTRALELAPEELCLELGSRPCISEVHRASLGGHDPFEQGLYEPLATPLVTSPLALDRVVQAACAERVRRDAADPQVFAALDLDGEAPARDSEAYVKTVETLYRRLLTRDPLPAEQDLLAELRVDADGKTVSAATFAVQACFAIGTTTEFIFL